MQDRPYSVAEITAYIKGKLDADAGLQDLWLQGEVSNWSRSRAGHCYLTIKDAQAAIRAVVWRSVASRLTFSPEDGLAVLARGRVSVYEPQGQYQLYVEELYPAGRGALYAQFEALRARLALEGLFDEARKRRLPAFPRCIGVVTSPTGAALRDILNVLERRWPAVQVLLSPTLVQGDRAPPQIVAALRALYRHGDVDLIIVARGGGSIEDLWAFNDEQVARTIAEAPVPVVCGVGHEVDFTIADLSADMRAPTPSAAAELAVPDQTEMRVRIQSLSLALSDLWTHYVTDAKGRLDVQRRSLARASPLIRLGRDRQRVDDLVSRLDRTARHSMSLLQERVSGLTHRLGDLAPQATLERGFAIVRTASGDVVRSTGQVRRGDTLGVHVADGEFPARVEAQ